MEWPFLRSEKAFLAVCSRGGGHPVLSHSDPKTSEEGQARVAQPAGSGYRRAPRWFSGKSRFPSFLDWKDIRKLS